MRIVPQLGASAYKSYRIVAPLATHWRPATCDEVACPSHLNGWQTAVDEATDLGQRQARYIRRDSARGFSEARRADGLTVFTFTAGQQCFTQHQTRLDREERFLVTGGDWRGNPLGTPRVEHTKPEFWVEDFAEHQDSLARAFNGGM